jgi:hypothetical protein
MSERHRLPNRRSCESFAFEHAGVRYTACVARYSDGRLAEIFIDASKPGSALSEHAADVAVLASLLLQHGITAAAIKHSISGPLATALALAEQQP